MQTDPANEADPGPSRDEALPALPPLPATIRFRRWLRQWRSAEENPHAFTEGSAVLGGCTSALSAAAAVAIPLVFVSVLGLWLTDPLWGWFDWPPVTIHPFSLVGCWLNVYGFPFVVGWGLLAMRVLERPFLWVPLACAIGLCAVTASGYYRTYDSYLLLITYGPSADKWRAARCIGACVAALFWGGMLTSLWYMADAVGLKLSYALRHPLETLSAWRAMRAGQSFQTQADYLEQVAAEEEAASGESKT